MKILNHLHWCVCIAVACVLCLVCVWPVGHRPLKIPKDVRMESVHEGLESILRYRIYVLNWLHSKASAKGCDSRGIDSEWAIALTCVEDAVMELSKHDDVPFDGRIGVRTTEEMYDEMRCVRLEISGVSRGVPITNSYLIKPHHLRARE